MNPGHMEIKRLIDVLGIALYSCGIDPDKPHSMVFAVSSNGWLNKSHCRLRSYFLGCLLPF